MRLAARLAHLHRPQDGAADRIHRDDDDLFMRPTSVAAAAASGWPRAGRCTAASPKHRLECGGLCLRGCPRGEDREACDGRTETPGLPPCDESCPQATHPGPRPAKHALPCEARANERPNGVGSPRGVLMDEQHVGAGHRLGAMEGKGGAGGGPTTSRTTRARPRWPPRRPTAVSGA